MIECVINYEDVRCSDETANEPMMFCAEEQCWNRKTLKELKEKYNIFFMSNGMDSVHPVMIKDNIVYIGHEDDGTIYFDKRYGRLCNGFSVYWIDSLINELTEVKKYVENKE